MTLTFPKVDVPLASVVVPTHNAWGWTSRALAAVHEHTDRPYEVIVCDNASSDETPMRLAELGNARIVLNAENLGFGTACNQGAALARSPYVVFLNSDAIVHENWLQPLLSHLGSSPSIGAVGPLLLNTDGSIQGAGSTVLGDALAISHGDEQADFSFPRVVDYVAGACLATRRALFHQVGGFDSEYGLGYYEDVDLCCRLRSVGYRVIFEPGSVVTHILGVSSGNELKNELGFGNQRLFSARWRHEFGGRPSYAESRALPAAFLRDLSADARLLVVPGPQTEPCRELARRLVTCLPNIRVTVLGNQPAEPRGPIEWISAVNPAAALRERRFYYDAVVVLDPVASRQVTAALDESQPQALRIEAGEDDGSLLGRLAQAGVACEFDIRCS